ncbi:DNA-deoxyinosine glycosylase [Chloroflexota bacterium]
MMPTVEGLDPIIDHNARVLILGSMPSTESLRKSEYYANPRNQFWRIIFSLFDTALEASYTGKVSFLKERRIALWDVIKQCDREGSSDSNITRVSTNDLATLLETYPKIKHICFNGQKAVNIFRKNVKLNASSQITLRVLPSSSPANTESFEVKISEWAIVKTLLTS